MKKTLVAIAALALVGAASAQSSVNLTGKFAFAYKSANDGQGIATSKASGFEVTDGNVVFAAVEDLGGGLKAGVSMDVRVRGRGAAGVVNGRDATVYLMGGFGSLVGGSVEAANGIIGLGGAGAPVIGLDNGVGNAAPTAYENAKTALDGGTNVDWLAYTTPNMGGFTGTIQMVDSLTNPGGGGLQSSAATQDGVLVGVAYSNGPVNAKLDYTSYGLNAAAAGADNRLRISGNYNLGVATIGAGYQTKETTTAVEDKQYILGVAAPFGPVTVGANYTRRTQTGGLKVTAWDLGAHYALSKRTGVQVGYQTIDSNSALVPNNVTAFRIRMLHSF